MGYFRWLNGFDTEVTIEFAKSIHGSMAWLRGLEISVIEEFIAWVNGMLVEAEWWFNCRVYYTTLRDEYIQWMNEQLCGSMKGVLRSLLAEP